jgi:FKBP-type peptidyl-prolyl cis-trans isomerase FkpA
MRTLHRIPRLAPLPFLAVALLLTACDDDSPTGPLDPTQIEFAAELGVDLDQMTRTSSGLYLLDEIEGDGEMAQSGSRVTVHYTGWLPDGRKFDSSLDRGEPFVVDVLGAGRVIQGWDEGLVGMRAGGRRLLVIPPHLAYGPNPIEGQSWATLVFRVDLLSVGN